MFNSKKENGMALFPFKDLYFQATQFYFKNKWPQKPKNIY